MPRCSRIAAASAIIAPLSVQSASSGKCTRTLALRAFARAVASRSTRVRADAAGNDEPAQPVRSSAAIVLRTSTSTIASCVDAARSARGCSQFAPSSFSACVRTAVFSPANEKSSESRCSSGRGKA